MKFPSPGAERVARALHSGGPTTAAALATSLGLSGAVVRRHLDSLVGQGLVVALEKPPFGPVPQRGRGRPARVFALTDRGAHAFDVAYDDLALSALRFLAETEQPGIDEQRLEADAAARAAHARGASDRVDRVAEFAAHRSRVWTQRHADAISEAADTSDRVDVLVGVLNEEGYAATVVAGDGGSIQICQHHCPVSHVAAEFPQLCEAETQAFEQLLGTHVLRLATIAHGDGVCTTLVPSLSTQQVHSQHDTQKERSRYDDRRTS